MNINTRRLLDQVRQKIHKFDSVVRSRTTVNKNRKADFIICGTQKGGTSALAAYLKEHPEVHIPDEKEMHFFDTESNFLIRGEPDYSTYHVAFNPESSHTLVGEATPIYMYWHDAPRRMWQYNPDLKLIVILRDPIDRAYSHWNMERSRNMEHLSFWEAITRERERCREALPYQHRVYSYVDRGFYMEQLRRLWTFFPKEQVLILRTENLRNRPLETLQSVCHYLQVKPFQSVKPKNVHSRLYITSMTNQEKEYLRSIFEYEIREMERVLGWDCSDWLAE